MERDSLLFYRSFYEAIQGLSKDIQLEIYTAVMEYGLNGVVPDNLKPVAKGMFALMKPVLDSNNVRFENGKKGGRKPQTEKKSAPAPDYTLTFEQEVEQMKADAEWTTSICADYKLTPEEYADRLESFMRHCNENRKKRLHDSFDDAKSHFRYWMDKAYPTPKNSSGASSASHAPSSARVRDAHSKKEEERRRRDAEYEERCRNAVPPDQLIRDLGYDPSEVTLAQALNPDWRAKNPPTQKL